MTHLPFRPVFAPALVLSGCLTASLSLLAQSAASPTVPPAPVPAQVASSPVPAAAVSAPVAAAAGVPEPVHIGILTPHSTITDPSAQAVGEQVRVLLARSLSSPQIDAVLLFSASPEQIAAEAKQHHCAYIIDSTITGKKASGLNKMMLLQGASMMMPMASIAGSMGGVIAGTAAGAAASTASSMGGFMHPNTTWTFDYKMVPVGETVAVLAQSETAKAKKEGEDVLTPMVQHAALAITSQARPK